MDAKEYQQLALATEPDPVPNFVLLCDKAGNPRSPEHNLMVSRLLHSVLGLMSETGEFADALKRHLIYGAELDMLNLVEESGDRSWYENLFLSAAQSSWEASWTKNIAKLKARFGDRFTQHAALNRDLAAERRALEGLIVANNTTPAPQGIPQASGSDVTARRDGDDLLLAGVGHYGDDVRIPAKALAALGWANRTRCEGRFRTSEDYRDHLPCLDCQPVPITTGSVPIATKAPFGTAVALSDARCGKCGQAITDRDDNCQRCYPRND